MSRQRNTYDDIISSLLSFGFDADDLRHLERLSDPLILITLPLGEQNLHFNVKNDVIIYLKAWCRLLEDEFVQRTKLPALEIRAFSTSSKEEAETQIK